MLHGLSNCYRWGPSKNHDRYMEKESILSLKTFRVTNPLRVRKTQVQKRKINQQKKMHKNIRGSTEEQMSCSLWVVCGEQRERRIHSTCYPPCQLVLTGVPLASCLSQPEKLYDTEPRGTQFPVISNLRYSIGGGLFHFSRVVFMQ